MGRIIFSKPVKARNRIPRVRKLFLDDAHDVVGRRLREPAVADLVAGREPQLRRKADRGPEAAVGLVEAEVVPFVGGPPPFLVVPPNQ